MSHEIRTPMNAVLGFCYLLEQQPLDQVARDFVMKINSSGRTLLNIINDILDFSKIEAGHFELEIRPFKLSAMLDHLAAVISSSASKKDLEFVLVPALYVDDVLGDELRLQQVLINLLSNAIKFTEHGEVVLTLCVESIQDDLLKLRFSVRDTGVGISPEHQENIFSPFTQADNTISRRFGGTGLGLAISRSLVELMGGRLQVSSMPGYGSEFWFELPMIPLVPYEPVAVPETASKILIIDDNEAARLAMQFTANELGWWADLASSGEEGLQQVQEMQASNTPYDLIIVDCRMPGGMDGPETVQALMKIWVQAPKRPRVLLASAYSLEDVRQMPGFELVDGFLTKPVTSSSLYDAIARLQTPSVQQALLDSVPDTAEPPLAGMRILVVDDAEFNREIAAHVLAMEGAHVDLAVDGQDALNWLDANGDKVDIILMDIQMPVLDGLAATREIRRHEHWRRLPVLALTADAFSQAQEMAVEAGMDDFVAKPFKVDALLEKIRYWRTREHPCPMECPLNDDVTPD